MASGEYSNAGLVQKLTPLVKGGQVFGKSVQNGGGKCESVAFLKVKYINKNYLLVVLVLIELVGIQQNS